MNGLYKTSRQHIDDDAASRSSNNRAPTYRAFWVISHRRNPICLMGRISETRANVGRALLVGSGEVISNQGRRCAFLVMTEDKQP
jgi:hypothetical protein